MMIPEEPIAQTDEKATDGRDLTDLTFNYEKGGLLVRRQTGKRVLFDMGLWATVAFKSQDLDLSTGTWKEFKITIARYKRVNGVWRKQSSFNANGPRQAEVLESLFKEWREQ